MQKEEYIISKKTKIYQIIKIKKIIVKDFLIKNSVINYNLILNKGIRMK